MKPVAIFRHTPTEGPGYFSDYLGARGVPWELVAIDQGASVPADAAAYAGLCFMGGPMSVNDDLPWIPPVLSLIRDAVARDVPVIGHCLGGQLMSRALGGAVTRSPVKEIGWGTVTAADSPAARAWLGGAAEFKGFHWHGETFSIPPGAERIAGSPWCANQAFALGPHLGLQCHVEMTPELVRAWCAEWGKEVERIQYKSVQSIQTPEQMQAELGHDIAALHAVADRLYDQWLKGLAG
jgi:GMP synthase-like glutamine amidotransferase